MSTPEGTKKRDYSRYDQMSTAELEQLLRLDFQASENGDSDLDAILYLSDLLARRDCWKNRLRGLRAFLDCASELTPRRTAGEIKIHSTVNVREMQKQLDQRAKELRELEETIQEANWTTELV